MSDLLTKQMVGKFDAESQVRALVASSFSQDASALLSRYDICNQNDSWFLRAFRAKMFVDLLMAIECALKSLIIALAHPNESPENVYKIARKHGHKLIYLFDDVKSRAKYRLRINFSVEDQKLLAEVSSLGVNKRYLLESWHILHSESSTDKAFGKGKISGTIDNEEWLKKVRLLTVKILSLCQVANNRFLNRHRSCNGGNLFAREKRLKNFTKAIIEKSK